MSPILPSCLAVNVRAETPNPMSSLVDPISSAFQEWRECLLEWTVDLNNKKYYQQKVLYVKMSEVKLIYLLWIHQTSQLLWDVDKLPLKTQTSLNLHVQNYTLWVFQIWTMSKTVTALLLKDYKDIGCSSIPCGTYYSLIEWISTPAVPQPTPIKTDNYM